MMKSRICVLLLVFIFMISLLAQETTERRFDEWRALEISLRGAKSITPKSGFVPDELTATKIGDAVSVAEYGEKVISKERPFRAHLVGDTWIVKGTLHPVGSLGGTAVIKISKRSGRILFLTHQE